jgi:hypothetical protein
MQFQMYAHSLGSNESLDKQHAEAKRELAYEQSQFYSKANRFVELWTKFAAQLNGQQTFDAKLAKKLSKAFHDLEKSEGWPVR